MSWLLPDTPMSGDLPELREHLDMLRRLDPRTEEVVEAIEDAERLLARLEREQSQDAA